MKPLRGRPRSHGYLLREEEMLRFSAEPLAKPAFISLTVLTKAFMIGECARSL